jgi:hypothetical protein
MHHILVEMRLAIEAEKSRSSCTHRPHSLQFGIWRCLTVNSGRSHTNLTCHRPRVSAEQSARARLPSLGMAGATSGPHMTGLHRTTAVTTGSPSVQLSRHPPLLTAGPRDPLRLSDTEEIALTAAPPSRLAYEASVTGDRPRPPVELATVAGRLRERHPSPAVPSACP